MRSLLGVLTCVMLAAGSARAAGETPDWIGQILPRAQIVGHGSMTYMIWDIYDATLYAPDGSFDPDAPFVMTLTYRRGVGKKIIVDAALDEMREEGISDRAALSRWDRQMTRLFPDAVDGMVMAALYKPAAPMCFFVNGSADGCIADPAFGPAFANIWLSPDTRYPGLRAQLLGAR